MYEPEPKRDYFLFFEEIPAQFEIEDEAESAKGEPQPSELAYLRSDQVAALGQDAAELITDPESITDPELQEPETEL